MGDVFNSRTILEAPDERAARHPDDVAVNDDVEAVTYREPRVACAPATLCTGTSAAGRGTSAASTTR